jgi:ABC-2 type transport system ATP-binding protein
VVFLDEPMSGLDPVGRREVRDIILDFRKHGRTVFFSTHILSDAEMLCDRVGVLLGGKLQGVGSPSEILDVRVQGMEILFELPAGRALPPDLADQTTQTGSRLRVEVPEEELYAALERLHLRQARILSVTPIKPTLEDYFFQLVGREKAEHHAVEVSKE